MDSQTVIRLVLIILAAVILVGLISYYNKNKSRLDAEKFYNEAVKKASEGKKKQQQQAKQASKQRERFAEEDYGDEDDEEEGRYAARSVREGFKSGNGSKRSSRKDEDHEDDIKETFEEEEEEEEDKGAKAAAKGGDDSDWVAPSDPEANEQYRPVDFGPSSGGSKTVNSCFPSDSIHSVDQLLPKDAANTKWAQVNPAGQGDVKDQNYLTAGFHIGINTIGQSLRNANQGLRSEPPNPRINVSPWMQSTIEPDLSRRPLEVGGS